MRPGFTGLGVIHGFLDQVDLHLSSLPPSHGRVLSPQWGL